MPCNEIRRPLTYHAGRAFDAVGREIPAYLLTDREEDARCNTFPSRAPAPALPGEQS